MSDVSQQYLDELERRIEVLENAGRNHERVRVCRAVPFHWRDDDHECGRAAKHYGPCRCACGIEWLESEEDE